MKLIGKTVYNGKFYSNNDVTGVVGLNTMGFDNDFYGGNVKHFGKTKDGLYLCLNASNEVIDIMVLDEVEKAVEEVKEEVKEYVCKKCGETFENKGLFLAHARKCK